MIEIKRDVCGRNESSKYWLLNGNASSPENNQRMVAARDYTITRRRQPRPTSAINEGAAGKIEEALGEPFTSIAQLATATTQFDSTKFTFNDASGNPVKYDENAVYLSFHHSVYETTMYEEFQKLGSKLKCGDGEANAALQRLKKGGDKKCFKIFGSSSKAFVQVDEQTAVESE